VPSADSYRERASISKNRNRTFVSYATLTPFIDYVHGATPYTFCPCVNVGPRFLRACCLIAHRSYL